MVGCWVCAVRPSAGFSREWIQGNKERRREERVEEENKK